jgi:sodium/hydrogen exchanger 8
LPREHKEVYVSTTLAVVIFTTVVCGGLTEPMLSRMGMRNAGTALTHTCTVVVV